MEEVLRRVVDHWRRQELDLSPPVSSEQIEAVWQRLDRRLSTDVLAFYRAAGGYLNSDMDDRCLSIWTIDETLQKNEELRGNGMLFADFLLSSHGYSFHYEEPSRSSVWIDWFDDRSDDMIASSVEEFLIRYLEDPTSLFLFA